MTARPAPRFRTTPRAAAPIGRRSLLGGAAAVSALTLAACHGSGKSGGAVDNATGLDMPTSTQPPEVEGAIISDVEGVPPGYTKTPADLVQTVEKTPGDGSAVTEFKITWDAPAPPLAQNKFWQSYNKRLSVDYKPTITPAASYDEKLATLLAGGDLPDIVQLLDTPQAARAIKDGAFADLTPVLGGSKIEEWKNLSTVRPEQWKHVAYEGKIVGLPIDLPAYNNEFRYRADWARQNGYPDAPQNADELAEVMTSFSKMGVSGRYGFADAPGTAMAIASAMYKVPNNWRYEDGELVNAIETDEYAQALEYMTKLWQGGAFHPDALALGENIGKTLSMIPAGEVGTCWIAAANWYQPGVYTNAMADEPDSWTPFVPPAAEGGGPGQFGRSTGVFGRVAISAKAAEDEKRLHMLLDVANYLRAPYGSVENYFLSHGEEGDYYTRTPGEEPVAVPGTDFMAEAMQFVYGLPPVVFAFPDAQKAVEMNEQYVKASVPDPCAGLFSDAATKAGPKLEELSENFVNQMIVGNKPTSELKTYREQWASRGGEDMRKEYLEALKKRDGES